MSSALSGTASGCLFSHKRSTATVQRSISLALCSEFLSHARYSKRGTKQGRTVFFSFWVLFFYIDRFGIAPSFQIKLYRLSTHLRQWRAASWLFFAILFFVSQQQHSRAFLAPVQNCRCLTFWHATPVCYVKTKVFWRVNLLELYMFQYLDMRGKFFFASVYCQTLLFS